MKEERSIKILENLTTLDAVEIGSTNKRSLHNKTISRALRQYYESPEGLVEREKRSERTKRFWDSPAGQAKKERLRRKYSGVKRN